jgi:hypothetical protein
VRRWLRRAINEFAVGFRDWHRPPFEPGQVNPGVDWQLMRIASDAVCAQLSRVIDVP